MTTRGTATASHWNHVAGGWPTRKHENPVLARHKRRVYTELIGAWLGGDHPARALKTDLFAEAFNDEEFVSGQPWAPHLVAIDISSRVLQGARQRRELGVLHGYVTCDVTCLPFRDGSFDFAVSDSTLDHFESKAEIVVALGEIVRVLSPGGRLILSIDNPNNLTYPPRWLVRLWMRLGLAPYYIGVTLSAGQLCDALESLGMTVQHQTAILHYPHPDSLVRLCEYCARRVVRGRLDGTLERLFAAFERLSNTRMRYVTGRYLAVNAVKESRS